MGRPRFLSFYPILGLKFKLPWYDFVQMTAQSKGNLTPNSQPIWGDQ